MWVPCHLVLFGGGTSIARPLRMVRHDDPGMVSEILPTAALTPGPDDAIEAAPTTKRLSALDLARALAAMELNEDEHRPSTDDEPTVDAPAPPIPPGVRSPLGDDDSEDDGESQPSILDADDDVQTWRTDETLTLEGLGLDLEDAFPSLVGSRGDARSNGEGHWFEDPDAGRAQRAVIGSWTLAAAALAFCTYLVATAGPNPYEVPASATRSPLVAEPSP